MNKNRAIILILGVIFVLACSIVAGTPSTNPATQPTYTPYPTYTPFPTQVVEPTAAIVEPTVAALPTDAPTEAPTQAGSAPLGGKPVSSDQSYNGTTLNASELWYFNGQEGQKVTITVVGLNHYQTFSIRNGDNKGLIGCNIETQSTCAIRDFKLPYTGTFYILVDRTDSPQYYKYCWNRWHGSSQAPVWCYVGGPYSLQFAIQ